jgi:hypothetical protein
MVEERLATALAQVSAELAQNPTTDPGDLLERFLKSTATRLLSVLQ